MKSVFAYLNIGENDGDGLSKSMTLNHGCQEHVLSDRAVISQVMCPKFWPIFRVTTIS